MNVTRVALSSALKLNDDLIAKTPYSTLEAPWKDWKVMKIDRIIVCVAKWCRIVAVFMMLVLVPLSVSTAAPAMRRMAAHFGTYRIYEIRPVSGGVIPDAQMYRWKGTDLVMKPELFAVRTTWIANPTYRIERIDLPSHEGEVMLRDLSLFWGVEADRKWVCRILVYEGAHESDPYMELEMLADGKLLDIYDGRAFFYKKLPAATSAGPAEC